MVYLTLLIFTSMMACSPVDREEILRVKSPESIVEVVLVRTNAGATVAFGYELFIVPTGTNPKPGTELFRADHVDNVKVRWLSAKLLQIEYDRARVFHFTNFWSSKDVDNFAYIVELRLVQNREGEKKGTF